MPRTTGFVEYSVEGFDEPFKVSWENGYLSHPTALAVPPGLLYSISPPDVQPTGPHAEAKWTFSQAGKVAAKVTGKPVPLEQFRTASPTTVMAKNTDWQALVTKATRAVIVTIDNKTRYKLDRVDHSLLVGGWALVPPETIAPNSAGQFAAHSTGLIGAVGGTVKYQLSGLADCMTLEFDNPFVGTTKFVGHPPKYLSIGATGEQLACSKITFVIQTKKKKGDTSNKPQFPAFNVMTQNTLLHPTRDGTIPQRAQKLLHGLSGSELEILCLQGLYHEAARNEMTKKLSSRFRHVSQPSGGLLVASVYPILEQSFFPFANGILDDLQTVKGIMGVKINIGSTLPNKILWIFTAHLQSDPSDDKDLHLVKTTRIQQVEACLRFVTKTLAKETKHQDIGVIFCGDLSLTAETDLEGESNVDRSNKKNSKLILNNYLEETPVNVQETVEALAQEISKNTEERQNGKSAEEPRIKCVGDVFRLLASQKLPLVAISQLRAALPDPRNKLMVLMAMTWLSVKQLIIEHLKSSAATQENAKQVYRNVILYTLQLLFGSPNIKVERPYYSQNPSVAVDADSEFDGFWQIIHNKLVTYYKQGLLPHEKKPEYQLVKQLHLLKYQLLRIFEEEIDIFLKEASKARIFKEESPVITIEDFLNMEFKPMHSIWGEFLAYVTPESAVLATVNQILERGQLGETEEYKKTITALKCTDVYRKLHPNVAGYTVMSKQTNIQKRSDFMFYWTSLGDQASKEQKLLTLQPEKSEVVCFDSEGWENQTLVHFGISTKFNIPTK